MKMSKRHYRIGELAESLNVEKFVIRFWEKELGIKSFRSPGGQRFYEEKDFQKFKLVKELLYNKKFTLAGAKNELENMKKNRNVIPTQAEKAPKEVACDCKEKLAQIRQQLLKFKQAL
jgi:DNA-binding transcriptional MerR regulator